MDTKCTKNGQASKEFSTNTVTEQTQDGQVTDKVLLQNSEPPWNGHKMDNEQKKNEHRMHKEWKQ